MKSLVVVFILVSIVLISSNIFAPDQGGDVMTGGVKDLSNPDAPKTIESKDIIYFKTYFVYADEAQEYSRYDFTAAKQADGTVEVTWADYQLESKAVVGPEFLVSLQEIIDQHKMAGYNGIYRVTSSLPWQLEPCSFYCEYESGEKISFYEDGNPDSEWMGDIVDLFSSVVSEPTYTDPTTG
ncbi:MAG: hypothetical protein ACOX3P_02795 [Saccharofermentanales bacterium]|jgi:hypothetical protein